MSAEEMTDLVFQSLKLSAREWEMDFDDYNFQVIHLTNKEGETFNITISKE